MDKRLIILSLITILILCCSYYVTTSTAFPQNPGTKAYFDKISNMPYFYTEGPISPEVFWKKGGNCDDRALAFATYLKSKGAKNVQICWVARFKNNTLMPCYGNLAYGHVFVVWNNKVYSPSHPLSQRFYGASISTYQKFLKKNYGFNTWYFENQNIGTPF